MNKNLNINKSNNLRVDVWCNSLTNGNLHQELLTFTKNEFYNLIVDSLRIVGRYIRNHEVNIKENLSKNIEKRYFLIGLDPKGKAVIYRESKDYNELVLEMKLRKERLSIWVNALAYDPAEYDKEADENLTNELLKNDHFPLIDQFLN